MNRWPELATEIGKTGYYPELVADSLSQAIAGEDVSAFVLSYETIFDNEEIRRHVTVAALTASRLVISHVDEQPADASHTQGLATASTEAVRLDAIGSVVIQRSVSAPASFGQDPSAIQEVVVTIGWGAVSRIDLAPAGCDDPKCEADHGFTGSSVNDDLTLRVSLAADGAARLQQAWEFAGAVSAATAR